MKKIIFIHLFLSLFILDVSAQKGKSQDQSNTPAASKTSLSDYELEEKIFREALEFNDALVARVAIFRMLAIKPEATYLYDTLMILYFNTGQFNEALTLSTKVLDKDESKLVALEIKSVSEQNLGLLREALTGFETLYTKTKNIQYLYQAASLQYDLKRVVECSNSINQLISAENTEEIKVPFFTQDRQRQEVPIKAAAYNMRGVLAGDLGELDLAAKAYEEALKIYPGFALAKNNLEVIKKRKEAGQGKPAAPKK